VSVGHRRSATAGWRDGTGSRYRRRLVAGRSSPGRGVWSDVSRRFAVAVNAVLVAVLVLGTAAFVHADKLVTVSVDGRATTVRTWSGDVAGLLAERGIELTWRDVVAPSPGTALMDGMEVTVRYSRPLALAVDGEPVEMWTTALTVDEVLGDLGMRYEAVALSTSRSERIPRAGLAVDVDLPDLVTFKHDGRRTTVLTTAATVRAAMREAGLRLGGRDRADASLSAEVRDGMVVTLTRVDVRVVRKAFRIDHSVVRRDDARLYAGEQKVVRAGHDGRGVARYRVTVMDGVVVRRVFVDRRVVRRPVDQVVQVGTKARVYALPGTPVGDLNWTALAACESSGNPAAVNPGGYYGLFQFDLGTWASVGGTGNPAQASAAEQLYRAQLLYADRGASPWPVCGVLLFT
jgi:uncharacterized protein YabE (DUF348 family)